MLTLRELYNNPDSIPNDSLSIYLGNPWDADDYLASLDTDDVTDDSLDILNRLYNCAIDVADDDMIQNIEDTYEHLTASLCNYSYRKEVGYP